MGHLRQVKPSSYDPVPVVPIVRFPRTAMEIRALERWRTFGVPIALAVGVLVGQLLGLLR